MKTKYTVRGAYGYDEAANSNESVIEKFDDTLCQRSQQEEADINTIVKRFGLTGKLPENLRQPTYGDFEDVFDYHTAQNAIAQANSSFQQLPPQIRSQFDNDPGKFVDYCSDTRNVDQLREWGLAIPKAQETAQADPAGPTPPGTTGEPAGAKTGSGQSPQVTQGKTP